MRQGRLCHVDQRQTSLIHVNYVCFHSKSPLHQEFEKYQLANAIASATDLEELKGVASQLLDLYCRQRAAAAQVAHEKLA